MSNDMQWFGLRGLPLGTSACYICHITTDLMEYSVMLNCNHTHCGFLLMLVAPMREVPNLDLICCENL